MVDEITKPKIEKMILKIDPEPPPQVQKNEPPHRRKKRKGEGYVRWLDKWPWKTTITKSSTEESFSREQPRVLALLSHRAIDVKQSDAWEATHEILI